MFYPGEDGSNLQLNYLYIFKVNLLRVSSKSLSESIRYITSLHLSIEINVLLIKYSSL